MSLEQLSDPEISYLALELSPQYQLVIKDVKQDVMSIIAGLYEVDEETYRYCRNLLEDWMYAIADMQEFEEPEEQNKYRPPGFDYTNKQK